ncbi:hypothetical protein [Nocardioides panacihumi]
MMLGSAVALAPDAAASKPDRMPAPIGNSNTFPAGIACPFTLRTELVGGNQVLTSYDDGRFHATGRHLDLLTNVDSGATTRLDLQGSLDFVLTANGGSIIRASGMTSFLFFPGDAGPGDTQTGRMYLFVGHFVATSDPSGTVTSFTSSGSSQDVCAMLS